MYFSQELSKHKISGCLWKFLKALDIKGSICPSKVIHLRISFHQSKPLREYLVRFVRGIKNNVDSKRPCIKTTLKQQQQN